MTRGKVDPSDDPQVRRPAEAITQHGARGARTGYGPSGAVTFGFTVRGFPDIFARGAPHGQATRIAGATVTGNTGFLAALLVATGAHVGALALLPATGGDLASGGGGSQDLSIAVGGADLAAALKEWDSPPEATTDSTTLASLSTDAHSEILTRSDAAITTRATAALPEITQTKAPAGLLPLTAPVQEVPTTEAAPVPPSPPAVDLHAAKIAALTTPPVDLLPQISTDAPALPDRAVLASLRPAPRIETRATGQGESATTGTGAAKTPRATPSRKTQAAAEAAWAAAIQSRIARAQVYPRGARGDGRVRLAITIRADGRLADVRIAQSSGISAFDKAALRAAKRAAPFPAAPDFLSKDRFAFGQWVAFTR